MGFPAAGTEAEFDALTRESLLPSVRELLGVLGHGEEVVPFEDGSLPVYAVGEKLVLKLFPPVHLGELATETGVLQAVHGRLPIPTPGVEQAGEHEGWGYVLMERLPGQTLSAAWPRLSTEDRRSLAPRLGEALAALHTVEAPPGIGPASWPDFLAGQRENVLERHRATKLDEAWVEQIPGFLDSVDLGDPRPVLLHTEFMRDHIMVTEDDGRWRISGLFDFEPAMRGAAEYDFVGVGLFVSGGDKAFLGDLLRGYGSTPDKAFERRCLAYGLLHVYSNLRWWLSLLPSPPTPTLDALAATWWAHS
ncbi:phosphotransferase family protein [Amycolatopsis sp. cg5]|uniref:phosphotransferase family protein n=1 Tax=Amycolatopsis sp. cg5 TaxID=3238802 RepID=UPI0035247AD6